MNQNPQYAAYPQPPYPPVAPIYPNGRGWQPPYWADPQKLEQKELRRASSRLSLAVLASLPLGTILSSVIMAALMLCGVNLISAEGATVQGIPATAYYLFSSVISFLTIVLPFALFLLLGKRRLADTILVEKVGFSSGLLMVFAGLFICMSMNIPANMISALLESAGLNGAPNTEGFAVGSMVDVITMLLAIVLVAPITEEFAFRGITVAVMRRWGDWPAVIFSAAIFAFAHYSFQALPVVFVGGFVMALLYVWTRNIWINIFVHFLNNLVATLPIIVEYFFGAEAAELTSTISFAAVCVLGMIALLVLMILHATKRRPLHFQMNRGVPVKNKALQIIMNPGFILYFITFIGMSVMALYAV